MDWISVPKRQTICFSRISKARPTYASQIPREGISVNGKRIERETKVKYLGLIIDHCLRWDDHINDKVSACRRLLFSLKSFICKTWGPSPEMVRYAYTS